MNLILQKGGYFINLIHNDAVFYDNVTLGVGIIICRGSIVSNDGIISDFTHIMYCCILGHDVTIGKFSRLGDYCFIGRYSNVGDRVFVTVRTAVLAKLKIVNKAILGAGSVVLRNVKEITTVFGNPAWKIEF